MQRLFRSFIKNGKESKDCSVLLKRTDAHCPTLHAPQLWIYFEFLSKIGSTFHLAPRYRRLMNLITLNCLLLIMSYRHSPAIICGPDTTRLFVAIIKMYYTYIQPSVMYQSCAALERRHSQFVQNIGVFKTPACCI